MSQDRKNLIGQNVDWTRLSLGEKNRHAGAAWRRQREEYVTRLAGSQNGGNFRITERWSPVGLDGVQSRTGRAGAAGGAADEGRESTSVLHIREQTSVTLDGQSGPAQFDETERGTHQIAAQIPNPPSTNATVNPPPPASFTKVSNEVILPYPKSLEVHAPQNSKTLSKPSISLSQWANQHRNIKSTSSIKPAPVHRPPPASKQNITTTAKSPKDTTIPDMKPQMLHSADFTDTSMYMLNTEALVPTKAPLRQFPSKYKVLAITKATSGIPVETTVHPAPPSIPPVPRLPPRKPSLRDFPTKYVRPNPTAHSAVLKVVSNTPPAGKPSLPPWMTPPSYTLDQPVQKEARKDFMLGMATSGGLAPWMVAPIYPQIEATKTETTKPEAMMKQRNAPQTVPSADPPIAVQFAETKPPVASREADAPPPLDTTPLTMSNEPTNAGTVHQREPVPKLPMWLINAEEDLDTVEEPLPATLPSVVPAKLPAWLTNHIREMESDMVLSRKAEGGAVEVKETSGVEDAVQMGASEGPGMMEDQRISTVESVDVVSLEKADELRTLVATMMCAAFEGKEGSEGANASSMQEEAPSAQKPKALLPLASPTQTPVVLTEGSKEPALPAWIIDYMREMQAGGPEDVGTEARSLMIRPFMASAVPTIVSPTAVGLVYAELPKGAVMVPWSLPLMIPAAIAAQSAPVEARVPESLHLDGDDLAISSNGVGKGMGSRQIANVVITEGLAQNIPNVENEGYALHPLAPTPSIASPPEAPKPVMAVVEEVMRRNRLAVRPRSTHLAASSTQTPTRETLPEGWLTEQLSTIMTQHITVPGPPKPVSPRNAPAPLRGVKASPRFETSTLTPTFRSKWIPPPVTYPLVPFTAQTVLMPFPSTIPNELIAATLNATTCGVQQVIHIPTLRSATNALISNVAPRTVIVPTRRPSGPPAHIHAPPIGAISFAPSIAKSVMPAAPACPRTILPPSTLPRSVPPATPNNVTIVPHPRPVTKNISVSIFNTTMNFNLSLQPRNLARSRAEQLRPPNQSRWAAPIAPSDKQQLELLAGKWKKNLDVKVGERRWNVGVDVKVYSSM
ncbi:hypothetical protein HK097_004164 [Rhizophlyctis rosea]|uniref:Uncharacterized protein n=1 Tax=Rhizophlyctis rosea TaxID=64517 RepID=A0AAD5SEA0_9FUNG|nr:hypothetical protein HK097_004164 [Rhizophlyctis rosea]